MEHRERLEPPAVTPLERQLLLDSSEQKRPNIQPVPQSSVLSKLKAFLPQMQQANAELHQRLQSGNPTEVDIEHIPEGTTEQIIQMDLACGLLELRDDAALAAAQRAIAAGGDVAIETYDGGDSSDTDSESDSSSSSSDDESAAVGAAGHGDAMQEAAAAEPNASGNSIQQQATSAGQGTAAASEQQQEGVQQQQQPGPGGRRRKVKAKRPMIVELPSST